MSNLSQFTDRSFSSGGAFKSTIILFDAVPGTKSWVCPPGVSKIRVFCVGGGADGQNGTYNSSSSGGGGGGTYPGGNVNINGAGASGAVVIKYPIAYKAATTTGSPAIITTATHRIYQFTSSGTITF